MKFRLALLRTVLVAVLTLCIWNAASSWADTTEYLMVPSAAMGRNIPVAFKSGGPHGIPARCVQCCPRCQ